MNELAVCGRDIVEIYDMDSRSLTQKIDFNKMSSISDHDLKILKWYNCTTDECKFINETDELLITSVAGMFLIYNMDSKEDRFVGWYPGIHSIEKVDTFYAIAVSAEPTYPPWTNGPKGHYLALISEHGDILWEEAFNGAHGVVYDENSKLLYALGDEEIRVYSFDLPCRKFSFVSKLQLPSSGGHDLSKHPRENCLFVSTQEHVYCYSKVRNTVKPDEFLYKQKNVKSISYNYTSEQIAFTKAYKNNLSCCPEVLFENNDTTPLNVKREIYKCRWRLS